MPYQQKSRFIRVKSPLGPDVLLPEVFSGSEGMSRPFCYQLQMISERPEIKAREIVGKNITIELLLSDGNTRHFNGFVSAFGTGQLRMQGFRQYQAEVVPWIWFLKRTTDCRVYQNKTVKQIIEDVCQDHGFSDFDLSRLQGEHPKREYCVQYGESDFDFLSRLMEEEGIFYWFKHQEGRHVLYLADHKGSYDSCPEHDVTFSAGSMSEGHLASWEHHYEFTTGRWAHIDYNYKNPRTNLLADEKSIVNVPSVDKYEVFEYPGVYEKKDEGKSLVRVRMEEEENRYDVVTAIGSCRTFFPGGKFVVSKHESSSEEGKEFLITDVEHHVTGRSYITGSEQDEQYKNEFRCIPASVTFRPPRQTAKPRIYGVQTATVVGPKDQEIYTDEDGYGRVKVQFHWDRYGEKNEKSSCWIRVAQALAGRKWGELYLPRIGQEVVVTFLEGDPDRPLIIGAVYNACNMPPITLPDYKTMSGIKTDSTKGGGGFNCIRFDDKKGEEQILIHAEKDQDLRVVHDSFEWVGRDRHLVVKRDQYDHVDNDRHQVIDQNHLIKIGGNRDLKVEGNETIEISGSQSLTVSGNVTEVFSSGHSEQTSNAYYLKATNVVIEAAAGITLKCGAGSVVVDPTGVTVSGAVVTIDGAMVKIASGPGSPPGIGIPGMASSPATPEDATEADVWEPGKGRRKN
jgi:type VI secretion system secreted protein VgrG